MIRTLEEWGRRVWLEQDEAAIDEMMVVGAAEAAGPGEGAPGEADRIRGRS
jgi:hypothetical protein